VERTVVINLIYLLAYVSTFFLWCCAHLDTYKSFDANNEQTVTLQQRYDSWPSRCVLQQHRTINCDLKFVAQPSACAVVCDISGMKEHCIWKQRHFHDVCDVLFVFPVVFLWGLCAWGWWAWKYEGTGPPCGPTDSVVQSRPWSVELLMNLPAVYETVSILLCTEEPSIGTYAELVQSTLHLHILFLQHPF
jgi:hypothetical protein